MAIRGCLRIAMSAGFMATPYGGVAMPPAVLHHLDREPPMQTVHLASAVGWGFPTWNQAEMIALLKTFDIRRIQIFRNRQKNIPAVDIRRPVNDAGLTISSLHAFFGPDHDLSLTDEADRRHSVENLTREADYVLALGGRLVVVHPGCAECGGTSADPDRVAALARSTEELARVAESMDILFSLENLPHGMVGDDMAVLRKIVETIDSPHLGLNYDCGHSNLTSDSITVLDQAGPRIVSTHIHDNLGLKDDHLPPGFGNVDMDAVCRGLARHGYRGEFTLELMAPVDVLRRQLDAAWTARLRRWLDLAASAAS